MCQLALLGVSCCTPCLLPSCSNNVFPTSANFESKHWEIWRGRKRLALPNRREFVCYQCTRVHCCLYRQGLGLCRHLDPEWPLELRSDWLNWADIQAQQSMLSSSREPPQWIPRPMDGLPGEIELPNSAKNSAFSESERERDSLVWSGVWWSGTPQRPSSHLPSGWSSGSRLSRALTHWSNLHSLSLLVTDLWRRLASPFKAGSLVICHCLHSRFFRRISSLIWAGKKGRGSVRWRI
jgi:hypothetical protein